MHKESHLKTSLHYFVVAFFSVVGAFCGLFAFFLLFALFQGDESTPKSHFTLEIAPNAEGVRKIVSKTSPVILKLNIAGVIGADKLTGELIQQLLVESREGTLKNDRVKGILLSINSPGGTVSDSDTIYRALLAYKKQYKTPIVAHVDGLCASGGFYIACAADHISTTPSSLVGSVGVLVPPFFNFAKVLAYLDVQTLTLTAGKGKDELNPVRPWGPDEAKPLQAIIDGYYSDFVNIVVANRPQMTREQLITNLGAHVFMAPIAQEHGYIDESNLSEQEVLAKLVKQLDIEDEEYQVVTLTHSSWVNALFDSFFGNTISMREYESQKSSSWLNKLPLLNQFLYLYVP